jgi:hypothetical protein
VRAHRQETAERFDEVGQHLATVDQRFEQIEPVLDEDGNETLEGLATVDLASKK